jgi:hypothetical protein
MPNGTREWPTVSRLRSIIARVRRRRTGALAAAGVVLAAFLTTAASPPAAAAQPEWTELKWPFPIDQWGIGKTFRCAARYCGREVDLHLRAKIGFCNCATGVANDEELERVADFDLLGNRPLALAPGRTVSVQKTTGRSRVHSISIVPVAAVTVEEKLALTIAFNHKCDAVVATVVVDRGDPGDLEAAALKFLNGDTVIRWIRATFGS